jgi:hypothetical protein
MEFETGRSWRAVSITLGLALAWATPVQGAIELEGVTQATFRWTAASGPVAGYNVYVSLNRQAGVLYEQVNTPASTVRAVVGDRVVVAVAAFDASGNEGPVSQLSDEISFSPADVPNDDPPEDPPADDPAEEEPPAEEPPAEDPPKDPETRLPWQRGGDDDTPRSPRPWQRAGGSGGDDAPPWLRRGDDAPNDDGDSRPWLRRSTNTDEAAPVAFADEPPVSAEESLSAPAVDPAPPGDVTGDGRADLVHANARGDLDAWSLEGDAVRESSLDASLPDGAEVVGDADYDGNGSADLLLLDGDTGRLSVLFLDRGRTIDEEVLDDSLPTDTTVVGSGDYDGDQRADVLMRRDAGADLLITYVSGADVLEEETVRNALPADANVLASGDYDGNGRDDVLYQRGQHLGIWGATGGFTLDGWAFACSGDVNGDARDDLLLLHEASGRLALYRFDAGLVALVSPANDTRPGRRVLGCADYDGDRRSDVVVEDPETGRASVWTLRGSRVSDTRLLPDIGADWSLVSVGSGNPAR